MLYFPRHSRILRNKISHQARILGFDTIGFSSTILPAQIRADFLSFLCSTHYTDHTSIIWLWKHGRDDLRKLHSQAISVIMLGINYTQLNDPFLSLSYPKHASISVCAYNEDYHSILKSRLQSLGQWIHQKFLVSTKVFTDTTPLLEKPLAQIAGLGWQGRHTNLVSRFFGSWLFLGGILTTLMLSPNIPYASMCGTCHRCLVACPTNALQDGNRIDIYRCISYLTIEHKGPVQSHLRPFLGNRIYGCDSCLAVCPWNHRVQSTTLTTLLPSSRSLMSLEELGTINAYNFVERFSSSPIQRIGYDRLMRNVLLAIGNSGSVELSKVAHAKLQDPSPLVRGAAVWALSRLLNSTKFHSMRTYYLPLEKDQDVCNEWLCTAN